MVMSTVPRIPVAGRQLRIFSTDRLDDFFLITIGPAAAGPILIAPR